MHSERASSSILCHQPFLGFCHVIDPFASQSFGTKFCKCPSFWRIPVTVIARKFASHKSSQPGPGTPPPCKRRLDVPRMRQVFDRVVSASLRIRSGRNVFLSRKLRPRQEQVSDGHSSNILEQCDSKDVRRRWIWISRSALDHEQIKCSGLGLHHGFLESSPEQDGHYVLANWQVFARHIEAKDLEVRVCQLLVGLRRYHMQVFIF